MQGVHLKKFRVKAKMTQSEMAEAIHKSRSAISKIENDEQVIDPFSLVRWTQVTGCEAQAAIIMFGADVIAQAAHMLTLVPAMIIWW
ncbi:helix-turn-helix transcriptional regulator [Lysinibacillus louembei]|uniref:Helix-turn-helix transcriptional regulator n=1 Tax=Lysinibacillus louembei TaxID=1470088 RepID=A0ABZ0RYD5_9BACI|nr:helix-turn-helix transcriptional regulator [Lysinibacillus louembei]WPK12286.1 helix-turn-helix transcriptional regulator [Lysinibacillus louembei]